MQFEDLIPLVAAIIYIFYTILKRNGSKKPAKTQAPKKKGRLTLGIEKLLEQARMEMEKAAEAEKAKEKEFEPERIGEPIYFEEEENLFEPEFQEPEPVAPKPPPEPEQKTPEKAPTPVFTKARLRDAVVMAEIIAPPLSLRE